jgi:hypothetical protein
MFYVTVLPLFVAKGLWAQHLWSGHNMLAHNMLAAAQLDPGHVCIGYK